VGGLQELLTRQIDEWTAASSSPGSA
jgi:hypothetical protein